MEAAGGVEKEIKESHVAVSHFSRPTLILDRFAFIFYTSRNTDCLSVSGILKAQYSLF